MLSTVLSTQRDISTGSSAYTEDISLTNPSPSIRLTQCEVMEVQPHLAYVVAHHLNPQSAARKVAGHKAGESRGNNVGDVVGYCGVAAGQEHATDSESHGAFTPRLAVLLSALVGVETVAHPPAIVGHAVTIHRDGE